MLPKLKIYYSIRMDFTKSGVTRKTAINHNGFKVFPELQAS